MLFLLYYFSLRMLEDFQMHLVYKQNFYYFFNEHRGIPNDLDLLYRMSAFDKVKASSLWCTNPHFLHPLSSPCQPDHSTFPLHPTYFPIHPCLLPHSLPLPISCYLPPCPHTSSIIRNHRELCHMTSGRRSAFTLCMPSRRTKSLQVNHLTHRN